MVIVILIISLIILGVVFFKVYRIYKEIFKKGLAVDHAMIRFDFDVDYFSQKPSYYYADFTRCIMNKDHFVDDEGLFYLGGQTKETSVLNVCGICEFALINYDLYIKTGNEENLKHFNRNLTWLVENVETKSGKSVWYYDMNSEKPWASGISQGMAISVLVRGFINTKNEAYLTLAKQAYSALLSPIHNSGFMYCYDNFSCWFEESADNSHILNGHIYALLGVYDLYRCTQDGEVYKIFKKGCENIKENIQSFDLEFMSTYDAFQSFPSNNSYHMIHIVLFEILAEITKDSFFKEIASKWNKVYSSRKLRFYGFVYTFNLLINLKLTNKWK